MQRRRKAPTCIAPVQKGEAEKKSAIEKKNGNCSRLLDIRKKGCRTRYGRGDEGWAGPGSQPAVGENFPPKGRGVGPKKRATATRENERRDSLTKLESALSPQTEKRGDAQIPERAC